MLNKEDIIIPKLCPILGIKIIVNSNRSKFNSPSIDRINPLIGYVKNNIAVISLRANWLKGNGTSEEIKLVYNNYFVVNNAEDIANKKQKAKLLKAAKKRAKIYKLKFNITIEDINVPSICPVLKIPLKFEKENFSNFSPTIDRIDNKKGYIKGNVRIISWRANNLKKDSTYREYSNIYSYIINNAS